jgi:glucoamylase
VLRRQVRYMPASKTLRITSAARFQVTWTANDWQTTQVLDSTQMGYAGSFADLPTQPGQTGRLSFTLYWSDEHRWEGRNFDVELEQGP